VVLAGCGGDFSAPEPNPRPTAQASEFIEDSEAYAVYAAVLQGDAFRGRAIKLFQETRPLWGCMQEPPPAWQPAMQDFREANARPQLLKEGIDLGLPYVLLTPLMIKSMMAGTAPRPESMLSVAVSRVGFNADKTLALVSFERECVLNMRDGTIVCNRGEGAALKKIAGRWEPSHDAGCSWIAHHNLQGADLFAGRSPT